MTRCLLNLGIHPGGPKIVCPGTYGLGHMPRGICPAVYAPGHIPGATCTRTYAWGHVPGAETLTCIVSGGTEGKIIVWAALGDATVLVACFPFRHSREDITQAHIWRPERADWLSQLMFARISRIA